MAWMTGAGVTPYGRLEGQSTLDLMTRAAELAIADAGLERREIDGLICGYSTTMPHIMLSTLFAEHFGLKPTYAHAVQVGGASGLVMAMLAVLIIRAGAARNVLVVAGENRLTGQTRDATMQTLAQAGHGRFEVPLGPTIPAYYGLVASRYMHEHRVTEADLAELAVLMRAHAATHPGAQLRDPITVADVLASKPIAPPLKFLDCCPISDGGSAFVFSRDRIVPHALAARGVAQAHTHQHVSAAEDLTRFGARASAHAALGEAGIGIPEIGYAGIYDSFTITLAILLEEIGLCETGEAGARAASGYFGRDGTVPLNTHGGLLSYGHCGVAGALAHLAETQVQMTRRAGERQIGPEPAFALLHGDGGIMSSHVSMVLERVS